MQGLDASADVVFMVGYHGSISGESSVLSHTYNPSVVSHVALNGVGVGESGINALVALARGVPVGLVTGDRQTAAEADPFLAGAERVVVKESLTRFGAVSLHPETARAMIADGARRAVERAGGQGAGGQGAGHLASGHPGGGHADGGHGRGRLVGPRRRADRGTDGEHPRRGPAGGLPVVRRGDLHHPGGRGAVRSASPRRRRSPGPGPSARSRRPGRAAGSSGRRPSRRPSPGRAPAT